MCPGDRYGGGGGAVEDMDEDPLATDIPLHVLLANDRLCPGDGYRRSGGHSGVYGGGPELQISSACICQ